MNRHPENTPSATSGVRHPPRRRTLQRWIMAGVSAVLGLLLWTVDFDRRDPQSRAGAAGWGSEAADAQSVDPLHWLPLAPANACGLGASSCFKCHNGKRAPAPASDPAKAPWHAHHAKVNNSCVGCHKGNPRVMKEDVAHAKLLPKPRDNAGGSCATCHTSDLDKVQAAYTGGK